jgi:hypothetical protein
MGEQRRKIGSIEALAYALTTVGNPCATLADKVDALIQPLTQLKLGLLSVKSACDALALDLLKVAKTRGEDKEGWDGRDRGD